MEEREGIFAVQFTLSVALLLALATHVFFAIFLRGKKLKKRQDAALGFPYFDAVRWDRAGV